MALAPLVAPWLDRGLGLRDLTQALLPGLPEGPQRHGVPPRPPDPQAAFGAGRRTAEGSHARVHEVRPPAPVRA
jgi:hypothetical protein